MKHIVGFFFISFLIFSSPEIKILYPNRSLTGENDYGFQLLKLVLSKVNKNYSVFLSNEITNQERAIYKAKFGDYPVIDLGIGQEFDDKFIPIYIPIERGLLGWRLLIIRSEDEDKFKKINNLKDLKMFIAGQGNNWSDNDILRSAGIQVMESYKMETLFEMLNKKRFDFFPLGVNEASAFLDLYSTKNSNLTIDNHLILVYPFARIFYVNKSQVQLAADIEKGLEISFSDGSFQKFFLNHKYVKQGLKEVKLKNRKIIRIENSIMQDILKKMDDKWWYNIN